MAKQLLQKKQQEDYEQALARLKTVLVYAADYAPAHVAMANVYRSLSNFETYEDVDHYSLSQWHLDRALTLSPDMPEALALKGRFAALKGQKDEALEYYKKSLELNPNQADTHNSLSILLFDKFNRYEEGSEANRVALMLDPLNADVRADYALSMIWIGRLIDAKDQIEKLKSLSTLSSQSSEIEL